MPRLWHNQGIMVLLHILLFVGGLIGVTKLASMFLAAAEKIGLYLKLPGFILGVVLVGFGTSLPELATSLAASFQGRGDVVLANMLGSNIANILLIIGLSTVL